MTEHQVAAMQPMDRRQIKMVAAILVWPAGLLITLYLLLGTGPAIENRLDPILSEVAVREIALSRDGRLCWTLDYTKQRNARPLTMAWSFKVEGQTAHIPAVVLRARDGQSTSPRNVATTGPASVGLCTTVPGDLVGVPGVSLSGAIEYHTSHPFWTLWYEFPPVPVPVT